MKLGYARILNSLKSLEHQMVSLERSGCNDIFVDLRKGYYDNKPFREQMIDSIKEGDVVTVTSLDRFGASIESILKFMEKCRRHKINLHILSSGIDTRNLSGKFMLQVASLFEKIMKVIKENNFITINTLDLLGISSEPILKFIKKWATGKANLHILTMKSRSKKYKVKLLLEIEKMASLLCKQEKSLIKEEIDHSIYLIKSKKFPSKHDEIMLKKLIDNIKDPLTTEELEIINSLSLEKINRELDYLLYSQNH